MGRWQVLATVGLVSLGACQLIAGLEDRTLADASTEDATSDVVALDASDASAEAACEKCGTQACVDLGTSAQHCGYCGHACAGCGGGVCPATTLASNFGVTQNYAFATDGVTIYFGAGGNLQFVTKDGKDAGTVIPLEPEDIAVASGGTLFLAFFFGVESVQTDGTNEELIYERDSVDASLPLGIGIAVNAPILFWETQSGIFSLQSDGGSFAPLVPENVSTHPTGMLLDATKLYFLDSIAAQLESISQGGGATTELANTFAGGTRLTLANGVLYWGTQDSLYETPVDGGASTPIVTNVDNVTDVATAGGRLFWIVAGTLPNSGAVMTMLLDGGSAAPLATNVNSPYRLLVDGTSVYWFEASAIKKVNW